MRKNFNNLRNENWFSGLEVPHGTPRSKNHIKLAKAEHMPRGFHHYTKRVNFDDRTELFVFGRRV